MAESFGGQSVCFRGRTVICRISVKSFMLLLQVLRLFRLRSVGLIGLSLCRRPVSLSLNWLSPRVSESVYDLHSISSFPTDFLRCHQTAWRYRRASERLEQRREEQDDDSLSIPAGECPKSVETQRYLLLGCLQSAIYLTHLCPSSLLSTS